MTAQDPYQPQMQPPAPAAASGYGMPQPHHAPPGPHPGFQPYPAPWPPPMQAPAMLDGFYLFPPRLKPIPSGQAIGALVAGIGGVIGSLPGLVAAAFSPWAGITFMTMAMLLGGGSILLASYSRRRIRASDGGISGRGMATTGLILGIVATSAAMVILLLSLSAF